MFSFFAKVITSSRNTASRSAIIASSRSRAAYVCILPLPAYHLCILNAQHLFSTDEPKQAHQNLSVTSEKPMSSQRPDSSYPCTHQRLHGYCKFGPRCAFVSSQREQQHRVLETGRIRTDQRFYQEDAPSSSVSYNQSPANGRRGGWGRRDHPWRGRADTERQWLRCGHGSIDSDTAEFRVVSWNILADTAVELHWRELYRHVPFAILNWNARKVKILQQIRNLCPHILCLQEVDRFSELREDLRRMGFHGTFQARTGNSPDGCATFWKADQFELLEDEKIQFRQHNLNHNAALVTVLQKRANSKTETEAKISEQGRAEGEENGDIPVTDITKRVVVANIHVLFNPKRGDVKLGQIRVLLERAEGAATKYGCAPIIITGDFNATPSSGVYNFIAKGELDLAVCDRRTLGGILIPDEQLRPPFIRPLQSNGMYQRMQATNMPWNVEARSSLNQSQVIVTSNVMEARFSAEESIQRSAENLSGVTEVGFAASGSSTSVELIRLPASEQSFVDDWLPEELHAATGEAKPDSFCLSHKLQLKSAYWQAERPRGVEPCEPAVTSCHNKFCGTVDYIWHTKELRPLQVLNTLPAHVLQRHGGLPHPDFPSDHLPLACDFVFAD